MAATNNQRPPKAKMTTEATAEAATRNGRIMGAATNFM